MHQVDPSVGKPLQQVVIHADVGPPEPVDALLGIADEEQLSGDELDVTPVGRQWTIGGCREIEDDLSLERIGVLELVDENPSIPLLGTAPDIAPISEQVARPGE